MGEHTRGPWEFDNVSGDIRSADGTYIIRQSTEYDDYGTFPNDADSRLIAAAPDLLQVVEDAEYALGNIIKPECWRDYDDMKVWAESMFLPAARAALAKVRGVLPSSHST